MQQKKKGKTPPPPPPSKAEPGIFPWDFRTKCIILMVLGFVFYANSLVNEYALDDSIAIERNEFVQKGVSGIGKILSSDAYASYYRQMGGSADAQYSGGRFRPFTFVTFAIEHQLFGENAFIRHFVNVALYLLCLVAILYFLHYFLLKKTPGGSDLAFLTVALFAIHPIHTEVVANIKSRDEIFSLLFIMCTFIFSLQYLQTNKTSKLVYGLIFYLLALLSKEYAITLIVLLPLLFYMVENKTIGESISKSLPYYGIFFIYLLIRIHAVGIPKNLAPSTDPLINPFINATHGQKFATEFYALGWYMCRLFYPYPLSCDYSFYQVAYKSFSDPTVMLSILLYITIAGWAFMLLKKRHILTFPVFFFLGCVALISNFLVDLGAVMGERLVFHASLGFLLVLSFYGLNLVKKWPLQKRKTLVTACLGLLVLVCGAETITRNAQWKDDDTLFIHDVLISSNDALLNNDAGWCYLGKSESKDNKPEQARAYLDSAKKYLHKGISIDKHYIAAYLNLAIVYFHYDIPDSAKYYLDSVIAMDPTHPSLPRVSGLIARLYVGQALTLGAQQKPYEAIKELKKGLAVNDTIPELWYNLGGAYFTLHNWDSARYAWNKTLQIKPDFADAQRGLQAIPLNTQQ